jgi:LmbE family N-acetylglucosaminyl deacetylase
VAFQIAGSVVRWLSKGAEVMVCTVTKGDSSTFDMNISSEEIGKVMSAEHSKAMSTLGIDDKHSIRWEYSDLGLDPGTHRLPLLRDMIWLIRRFRPATVVTMDPKNAENEENPDHKLVAVTALEAAAMSAYPNVFREQFDEPGVSQHFVGRMLFYMSPEPDFFIDISGEAFERKIEAGFAYSSQLDLMKHEAKERLKSLGMEFPLFDVPKGMLWPVICAEIAAEAGRMFSEKNPKKPAMKQAEAFRQQYLGIVDKIKSILPADE